MSNEQRAIEHKNKGNEAFKNKDLKGAVEEFTKAIELDPKNAVYWSNRSMVYASNNQNAEALKDAEECVKLKPDWTKGYSRKGVALFNLKRFDEAKATYEQGLKFDANDAALKDGVESCVRAMSANDNPMAKLFDDSMWAKLANNAGTRELLKQPDFVNKMKMLQANPNLLGQFIQDKAVSKALGVLFGLPADVFAGAGGDGGAEDGSAPMEEDSHDHSAHGHSHGPGEDHGHSHAGGSHSHHQPETKAPPPPAKELTPEEKAKQELQARANAEKEKGNAAFNAKKWEEAIEHYNKAIEILPTDMTYRNNRAAVYLMQGKHQEAIQESKEALAIGAEHGATYEHVAKAWARIGTAHMQLEQYNEAIAAFDKSMVEDRTEKVAKLLKQCKEIKAKKDTQAYLDPAKAEEHKNKGNELFQQGMFREAILEFTEALRRDPKNVKVMGNRAAAYMKVMDWARGLEDCDAALKLEPNFVKAYVRKGKIQFFLKQYHKALDTYTAGLKHDPKNAELLQGQQETLMAVQAANSSEDDDPARAAEAMKDPEIQAIMRDPTISKVLQDMQRDPSSAQAALRDPDISAKLQKLIVAGILKVGGRRPNEAN